MTAIAAGENARPTPPASGLVPTATKIREAKRDRAIACAVWCIPLFFLLLGMYWRIAVSTLVLHLGLFTWILPLFVVTVIAAILYALVVEPASHGNQLGEEIRAATAVDNDAVAEDERLADQEEEQRQIGNECIEEAHAELTEARDMLAEGLERGLRGRQLAAAVLNVDNVPSMRSENLVTPEAPQVDRIVARLNSEYEIHSGLVGKIGARYLPPLAHLPGSHDVYLDVPELSPNAAHHPEAAPVTATSTLGAFVPVDTEEAGHSRRQWGRLTALLLIMALVAAAAWFLLGHGTATSASAPPLPVPTVSVRTPRLSLVPNNPTEPPGLKEGVDYSFLQKDLGGQPARWSCGSPIQVRVAGPVPAGGAAAVASAVKAVKQGSGLPLVVGMSLPNVVTDATKVPAGTITVSFVTPPEIKAAHLDMGSDVLGRGGPMVDSSGTIISGWVAIRDDGTVTPSGVEGIETVWHELGHSVNLGHSAPRSAHHEVMEPDVNPTGTSVSWGPGDRYALAALGCRQAS